jgi:hypothetical protein
VIDEMGRTIDHTLEKTDNEYPIITIIYTGRGKLRGYIAFIASLIPNELKEPGGRP